MPVEMACGEERRPRILDERQLVALRLDPEHDHVGVAFAAVRIDRVGLRRTEEHERLAAHLINGVALRPLQAVDVRHRRGQPMHIAYPGGSISHSGDTTAFPLTSRYPPAPYGITSDVAVDDDSSRLARLVAVPVA